MLRRASLAAALILGSLGYAHAASDADFTLKNSTGYQIDEVYVSPHSSKNWGRDIMGQDSLGNAESVRITFPHGNGACQFDIQVKYHDGDQAEWDDVNLCNYDTITLFWDSTNHTTRAIGE